MRLERQYYCPVEDHTVTETGWLDANNMCVFCYMHRKIDDLELVAAEMRDTEPCPPPGDEFA